MVDPDLLCDILDDILDDIPMMITIFAIAVVDYALEMHGLISCLGVLTTVIVVEYLEL